MLTPNFVRDWLYAQTDNCATHIAKHAISKNVTLPTKANKYELLSANLMSSMMNNDNYDIASGFTTDNIVSILRLAREEFIRQLAEENIRTAFEDALYMDTKIVFNVNIPSTWDTLGLQLNRNEMEFTQHSTDTMAIVVSDNRNVNIHYDSSPYSTEDYQLANRYILTMYPAILDMPYSIGMTPTIVPEAHRLNLSYVFEHMPTKTTYGMSVYEQMLWLTSSKTENTLRFPFRTINPTTKTLSINNIGLGNVKYDVRINNDMAIFATSNSHTGDSSLKHWQDLRSYHGQDIKMLILKDRYEHILNNDIQLKQRANIAYQQRFGNTNTDISYHL